MKSKSYTWKTVAILSTAIGLLSTQLSAQAQQFDMGSNANPASEINDDPLSNPNNTSIGDEGTQTASEGTSSGTNIDGEGTQTASEGTSSGTNIDGEGTQTALEGTDKEPSSSEPITEEAVPEPLSILGTGAAFGLGVYFKRKRDKSKNQA